jgi:hypothetical protein
MYRYFNLSGKYHVLRAEVDVKTNIVGWVHTGLDPLTSERNAQKIVGMLNAGKKVTIGSSHTMV